VKGSLVDLLRSPVDGSRLALEKAREDDGEVVEGTLFDASGNSFVIDNGIPLFAPDADGDDAFAFKWSRIGASYGHDEATRRWRRQWYLERFGYLSEGALQEFVAAHAPVLDAGAGSGADAAMFATSGATVVAADLSRDAARATYATLGRLPNVHVIQADVARLPFAAGAFGYVSSDQVIHHTRDAAATFAALARLVAPGGSFAVYVYARKGPIREFVDDFVRERTTRMPIEECYEFSRAITLLGRALAELESTVELPEDLPLLGIPGGKHDVQRLFYWHVVKCFWNGDYDFETNVMVNFDWYRPRYASRHEPDEVQSWYGSQGFDIGRLHVSESGIAAVGRRAAEAGERTEALGATARR
jgi:SAM-dependent methyltransferase